VEVSSGASYGAIAERAAHRSTAARALRCTKCDGENGKTERGSLGRLQLHLMAAGRLLWTRVTVAAQCGGPRATRRQREASERCPRPPPGFNCGKRRLGQRQRLSLGQKYARYRALFIGSFDRIVDGKNSNIFIV
jgi:hypothetical protein